MWLVFILRSVKSLPSNLISIVLVIIVSDIRFCGVSGVRVPSPVEVNKCCRIGETLGRDSLCSIGEAVDHWWPPIYLIGKQSLFPKQGEAPRFLRAHENKQPLCSNPELISNNIALFSNGSLFLGERSLFINIENYCIDKDVALVCLPKSNSADSLKTRIKLTKIRKCCSSNFYLTHAQTCVPQLDEIPNTLFQTTNTSSIDLVYGFPQCSSNKYVIADQFHEDNLKIDNGSYILQNTRKVLTNDEFCVDYSNQNANITIGTVFACDELVTLTETSEHTNEEVRKINSSQLSIHIFTDAKYLKTTHQFLS